MRVQEREVREAGKPKLADFLENYSPAPLCRTVQDSDVGAMDG
jgi:hypothetical protein